MATRKFNIFVEGTDDHDLVRVLVQQLRSTARHPTITNTRAGQLVATYLLLPESGDELLIASVGGWDKLGANQAFQVQEARNSGGKTLVVFDADKDPEQRAALLTQRIAADDPGAGVYLLPGPGQAGDLETLLLQLVPPAHRAVMDCYDRYEHCLQQLVVNGQNYYHTPSAKRRIYDYVNVMPLQGKEWERHHEKGGQKIFENPDLWNLDAPALQPLRAFLDRHIR